MTYPSQFFFAPRPVLALPSPVPVTSYHRLTVGFLNDIRPEFFSSSVAPFLLPPGGGVGWGPRPTNGIINP